MKQITVFSTAGTNTAPSGGIITGGYVGGNKLPATNYNYYLNAFSLQNQELINVLTAAGITPDATVHTQLLTAINTLIDEGGSGTQVANRFLAGPTSGSPAAASFRAMVPLDLTMTTTGDIIQDSAGAITRLASVATGNALISGGVATISSWGKIGLTTHISGVLAETNGGTNQSTYTTGDLLQASASNTLSKLASVATGNVLISGGVTTVSSWGKVGLTTHVSGTLPVTNGGIGIATVSQGDLLIATASNTLTALAKSASDTRYLSNTGTSNNPAWAQVDLTNGVTGNLPVTNLNSGTSASASTFWCGNGTWSTPAGAGTVTSVALSLPSFITVSGSPVTGAGTLTGTLATQTANLIFSGPSSGSAAAPTFRALVTADMPSSALVARAYVHFDATSSAAVSGTYSRATTTVTATVTGHGLSSNNIIQVTISTGSGTTGLYTITVVDANTFTYTEAGSGTTSGNLSLPRRTIVGSTGISCVSYVTTGSYVVNFSTALTDANYAVSTTIQSNNSAPYISSGNQAHSQTASAFYCTSTFGALGTDSTGSFVDVPHYHAVFFR